MHERQIMSQLRQRLMRGGSSLALHAPRTSIAQLARRPVPVEVKDEQLRFDTENLLTFTSLIACPLPVRADYAEACKEETAKVSGAASRL